MTQQAERRKSIRIQVYIRCTAQVILPEDTFSPQTQDALILNISKSGLKLSLSDPNRSFFHKLTLPYRYIKVDFPWPSIGERIELVGRVVWLNYIDKRKVLESGLYFDKLTAEQTTNLSAFINNLLWFRKHLLSIKQILCLLIGSRRWIKRWRLARMVYLNLLKNRFLWYW